MVFTRSAAAIACPPPSRRSLFPKVEVCERGVHVQCRSNRLSSALSQGRVCDDRDARRRQGRPEHGRRGHCQRLAAARAAPARGPSVPVGVRLRRPRPRTLLPGASAGVWRPRPHAPLVCGSRSAQQQRRQPRRSRERESAEKERARERAERERERESAERSERERVQRDQRERERERAQRESERERERENHTHSTQKHSYLSHGGSAPLETPRPHHLLRRASSSWLLRRFLGFRVKTHTHTHTHTRTYARTRINHTSQRLASPRSASHRNHTHARSPQRVGDLGVRPPRKARPTRTRKTR